MRPVAERLLLSHGPRGCREQSSGELFTFIARRINCVQLVIKEVAELFCENN